MSVHDPLAAAVVNVAIGVSDYGPGSGRFGAIIAALVGLTSLVIGGLALARAAGRIRTGPGRGAAILAAEIGLLGIGLSVWHFAGSSGGYGTGNGAAGAHVALLIALIGVNLSGLAVIRSRRADWAYKA